MTFLEHLDELRSVLFVCLAGFFTAAVVSLVFYRQIFAWLRLPLENAVARNPEIAANGGNDALTSLHFLDPFSILFYIALLGGIIISSPLALYKIGGFVAPALTSGERGKFFPVCIAATLLFLAGAGTAFFALAPLSINFMYFFSGTLGLNVNWIAADYYAFIVTITLFTGLIFEFPLIVVALQYFEIISTKTMLEKWRYVVAGTLIIVAVLSPVGDPIAMIVLTGTLFLLYIAAVLTGDFLLKHKKRKEEKENEEEEEEEEKEEESPAGTASVDDADGDLRSLD